MAAKETSRLVPLCHNINLAGVEVGVECVAGCGGGDAAESQDDHVRALGGQADHGTSTSNTSNPPTASSILEPILHSTRTALSASAHGGIMIHAQVKCHGQTGVEMEALTAASVAALTCYDMCKAVDRGMRVDGTRVVFKSGGASGTWFEREGVVVEGGEGFMGREARGEECDGGAG